LGPLFVGFLLFDATRGLFVGWLRLLAGAALGVVATSIALGVELALLEPWLSDLLARRVAQQPIPGAPAQLLAATIVFALVLIVMIGGAARAAWALRLPTTAPVLLRERFERRDSSERSSIDRRNAPAAIDGRSRASVIVDAVTAAQRREATAAGVAGHSAGAGNASSASITIRQSMNNTGGSVSPQGAPSRRRASVRGSASARRRDFNA
ncbi:MAG TPA: type IV secretion system protein, partial [Sphingomonas sp.]|nr:type IV secretion system protein [Sphingomonas sp.]